MPEVLSPPSPGKAAPVVVRMSGVDVRREGRPILTGIDWTVTSDQHWVVLGPNGSGKTTLISLLSGYVYPARGEVEVLGTRLGRTDVRGLRARLGLTSAELSKQLRGEVPALEVVLGGRHAALEVWWHDYSPDDYIRARQLLEEAGLGRAADQAFRTLSEGERQQVQLARVLMGAPELLVLDEPNAGLDLGAREGLLARLGDLARRAPAAPMVLITHHLEEIPPGFTHLLLMRQGRVVGRGPLEETLTSEAVSDTFGLALEVVRHGRRYGCHAVE